MRDEREVASFTHANLMGFCNGLLTSHHHCRMLIFIRNVHICKGNVGNYESFVVITVESPGGKSLEQ